MFDKNCYLVLIVIFFYGIGAIEEVGVFDKVFLSQFDALVDVVSHCQWAVFEGYVEKLRRFRANVMAKEREGFKFNPNHFNALIHGDLWTNNIMIKSTTDNQIENMVFIDFQSACWGSSTIDLHQLMSSSLKESVRRSNLNELVEFYHSCLIGYLNRLEYSSIPTFQEFQREFNERNIHGKSSCISHLSFSKCIPFVWCLIRFYYILFGATTHEKRN